MEVSLWGKKEKILSRSHARTCGKFDVSLSPSLCKSKQRDTKGGVGVHIWMNRHTDGYVVYVTFHYLGRCLALLLYAIRYVSKRARARGYVFAYSSARANVANYISRFESRV